jgi:putative PIG3 family NAD(P)H quinone oxidoreductase
MRAAVITRPGPPDVLEVRDVPRPSPADEELLIRVVTSSLNRADILQREGRYPVPPGAPADIPGMEFAGEVVGYGSAVRGWTEGDRAFGIVGGGAHAEFLVVHADAVARLPASIAWTDAGASPEAYLTAHDAMVTQAQLRAGERVLIHAVGSGVGLASVQIARAFGAIPYGTSRTSDKIARAREHGLEDGIALGSDVGALAEAVAVWSGGKGMSMVMDLVGGPYVAPSVAALAPKGRLMLIGTVAGATAQLDLGRVLRQRLTIRGTVLRSRSLEEKIAAARAFASEVVPLLERGVLRPVIDARFALAEIVAAHRRLESNDTFGKVVIEMSV